MQDKAGKLDRSKNITARKRAEAAWRQANATLEQRVAERTAALRANLDAIRRLHKLGMLSARRASLPRLLEKIVEAAIAISGADFGNIQLVDPESGGLRIAAQRGFPEAWIRFWNNVSKGKGVCGTALERGERVIVEDIRRSPIFAGSSALEVQLKAGVCAVQSTPLMSRSRKILGMLSTHYKAPRRPDGRTLSLLDILARQAAVLIERAQAERALEQANFSLRQFARRLTRVEESERRRLAYMLHEGLQQLLVSAMFQLSDARKRSKDGAVRKSIAEVVEVLDECVNVTRTATYASYPPALQQLGVAAALGWLGQYCQRNLGLSVDLQADEAVRVEPEEVKICVFRAAQELLLNVARHARVKRAKVRLGGHAGGSVWLEVSDAGAGFDPDGAGVGTRKEKGFGLFSLRERAAMLGGRLEVESARAAGTRVRLWLPAAAKTGWAGDTENGLMQP
jgi:signal transduction histidine kinase